MKILKHGDLKPRKFICEVCGCEFVADRTEYGVDKTFAIAQRYVITCPCCKHRIFTMCDKVPLYKEEVVDEHVAKGCGHLMNFYKKKKEWYKIMHDILETMEKLDDESKTNN